MATEQELDNCVTDAIQIVRQRVKQARQAHPQVKHRINDYPAMVVACGYRRGNEVFWSHSVNHVYTRTGINTTIGVYAEPIDLAKVEIYLRG